MIKRFLGYIVRKIVRLGQLLTILASFIVRKIVRLVYVVIILAFFGLPLYLLYMLDERIIPLSIILFRANRLLRTVAFLDIRYYRDGTSTWLHIYEPELFYIWHYENWEDRFSKAVALRIPNIRLTSDMRRNPLPHGLSELDKVGSYLRKVACWNLLVFSVCGWWLMSPEAEVFPYYVAMWGLSIVVGLVYYIIEKLNPKIRWTTRRRLPFIRKPPIELCESLSLGVINRAGELTAKRFKLCIYAILFAIAVEVIYFVLRRFPLW